MVGKFDESRFEGVESEDAAVLEVPESGNVSGVENRPNRLGVSFVVGPGVAGKAESLPVLVGVCRVRPGAVAELDASTDAECLLFGEAKHVRSFPKHVQDQRQE